MDEKDICSEGQEDIEILLAKADSLAQSLGVALDKTFTRADKYCNDFLAWLKASKFEIDETLIIPDKLETFYSKGIDYREEKNSIKAEIYKLDDFIELKKAKLSQIGTKVQKAKVYADKIEDMKDEAFTELNNLKKQQAEEIDKLTKILQEEEDIIACLKGEKSCDDPSIILPEDYKVQIRKGLSYSK